MAVVLTLGNLGLKDRHWEKISEIIGFPLHPNQNLSLSKIMDYNLDEFVPKFEVVSDGASKETALEKKLQAMEEEWKDLYFTLMPHRLISIYYILWLYSTNMTTILNIFLGIQVLIYYLV